MADKAKNAIELDTLYNSDCIVGMKRIPAGSVDLAFADPPFNIGYKYDVYEDRMKAEEYLAWSRKWGEALIGTLKPTGTFWLAIGDDFAAELKMMFQRELGLVCRSWVIWYYTFGVHCKYKFARSHTHLFHFVKDPKNHTFNTENIRVPSARQLVYGDSRADSRGRLPDDTWILRPQDAPESFTAEEDTWYVPRVCGTFKERAGWHGCQMPEQILGRIIRACSNKGETVLDPFGGSGTTLVTAKKLERRFIGFELSRNYAKQIHERLGAAKAGDPLSGSETGSAGLATPPVPKVRKHRGKGAMIEKVEKTEKKASPPFDRRVDQFDGMIQQAFFATRDGYPVDRVIADPALNEKFVHQCRQLKIPGKTFDWNHRLMGMRKFGALKGLARSRQTVLPNEERDYDRYKFACEIAIQNFEHGRQLTLDHVLCDPELAGEFDRYVLSMLPDRPDSLKIRWYALRVRKSASFVRKSSAHLNGLIEMPVEARNPYRLDLSTVPAAPGMYWLMGKKKNLYVGETGNLRDRFVVQFGHRNFAFWDTQPDQLRISFTAVSLATPLPRHQSRWISKWQPIGNYKALATR